MELMPFQPNLMTKLGMKYYVCHVFSSLIHIHYSSIFLFWSATTHSRTNILISHSCNFTLYWWKHQNNEIREIAVVVLSLVTLEYSNITSLLFTLCWWKENEIREITHIIALLLVTLYFADNLYENSLRYETIEILKEKKKLCSNI